MSNVTTAGENKPITEVAVSFKQRKDGVSSKNDVADAFDSAQESSSRKTSWKDRFISCGEFLGEKSRKAYNVFNKRVLSPAKSNVKEWGTSVKASLALAYAAYQAQRYKDKLAKLQDKIMTKEAYIADRISVQQVEIPQEKTDKSLQQISHDGVPEKPVAQVSDEQPVVTSQEVTQDADEQKSFAETKVGQDLIAQKREAMQQSDNMFKNDIIRNIYKNLETIANRTISREDLQELADKVQSVANKTSERVELAEEVLPSNVIKGNFKQEEEVASI